MMMKTHRLSTPPYMAFPFSMGTSGPKISNRAQHIREQILQVLYTDPYERVFDLEFGAGVKTLLFEPNQSALWNIVRSRLVASLTEALFGEVDPKSLDVQVEGENEQLKILISYTLAAIGISQEHVIPVGNTDESNG